MKKKFKNNNNLNMKNSNENIVQTLEKFRRTELLLQISRKIAGLKSLEEILWTLIEFVTNELDADRGTLFLNDNETNELYSRVSPRRFDSRNKNFK